MALFDYSYQWRTAPPFLTLFAKFCDFVWKEKKQQQIANVRYHWAK